MNTPTKQKRAKRARHLKSAQEIIQRTLATSEAVRQKLGMPRDVFMLHNLLGASK